jgi:hypothetical protein
MLNTDFSPSTTVEICPIFWETFGQYGEYDGVKRFLHHITNNHGINVRNVELLAPFLLMGGMNLNFYKVNGRICLYPEKIFQKRPNASVVLMTRIEALVII